MAMRIASIRTSTLAMCQVDDELKRCRVDTVNATAAVDGC